MTGLLKPCNGCCQGVEDTLYYHIVDRKTGIEAYVFSEYNALFANEAHKVVGKCFYLYLPGEHRHIYGEFKTKDIAGRTFLNLGYRKAGDDYVVNSDADIKKLISERNIFPEYTLNNLFAHNYTCFDEADVVGVSEPRGVLKRLCRTDTALQEVIEGIIDDLDVCIEDLGITGSMSLGVEGCSDYDIVFYGDIRKLNEIKLKIDYLRTKRGNVVEYGLKWPCRYYDRQSNLICCFFVCTDYNYEIYRSAQIVCDNYAFHAVVRNDTYSILKAPVLDVSEENASSVIIFNSGFKGVFRKGDGIEGEGKLIKYNNGDTEQYAILCTSPFEQICNYTAYFNR